MACLEDFESMPAESSEKREGVEEGIMIHPSCSCTRILGENGHVTEVECIGIQSLTFDQTGVPHFDVIQGSERVLHIDTVIFAIGQFPELEGFHEIATTTRGYILIDALTMATNQPGIFAGGDVAGGPASVIEAIASGRQAALSIHLFLEGLVIKETKPRLKIKPSEIEVELPTGIPKQARQPILPSLLSRGRLSRKSLLASPRRLLYLRLKGVSTVPATFVGKFAPIIYLNLESEDNPKMQMCKLMS